MPAAVRAFFCLADSAIPVAAGVACDRRRSRRKTRRCGFPGRSRTQVLRQLRCRSQPRKLGSGYTGTAIPVAAAAGCDRPRSGRKTGQRDFPDRSRTQVLRQLRCRSQPRKLGSGYTGTAIPVAAAAGCDRPRSGRKTGQRDFPGRSRTQVLRQLRYRSQPRKLGSGYTGTAVSVAAAAGCDRPRSSRKTGQRDFPGRSRTQVLRQLRCRSQPRGLGSGYTGTAM
ncbi:Fibronectin type III domain protein [Pseudomonas chlororaphis subsp. aureofaciens]|nr:Fibronectin type III domain protein [Pseudomonas chlororaphis subsp. aureofaciens]